VGLLYNVFGVVGGVAIGFKRIFVLFISLVEALYNHLNDEHSISPNKIFEALLKSHQP
jgi:hypothetical protein